MLRPLLSLGLGSAFALAAFVALPGAAHAQVPGQYGPGQYGAPPGQYSPGQYGAPPGNYAPPPQYPQYGQPYQPPYSQPYPQYGTPYQQYPQQPPYQAPPSPPWGQFGIVAHFSGIADTQRNGAAGYGFGLGVRTWALDFPFDIGGEVETDRYDGGRNDYRVNADIYLTGWKSRFYNVYLLGAGGFNFVTTPAAGNGYQGSIGGGAGFQLKVWRIAASAEGRAFYRAGDSTSLWAKETVVEARINLMVLPFDL